jgi:hypothetical protein
MRPNARATRSRASRRHPVPPTSWPRRHRVEHRAMSSGARGGGHTGGGSEAAVRPRRIESAICDSAPRGENTFVKPPRTEEDAADQYRTTLQWSRRAIGLKVFMSLAEGASSGLAERIDHQARMGETLRGKLNDAGWTIVNRYTHCSPSDLLHARGHPRGPAHDRRHRPLAPGSRAGLDIRCRSRPAREGPTRVHHELPNRRRGP